MKTAYAWVAVWPEGVSPRVSIDLFFSSPMAFHDELGWGESSLKEQLVEVQVPDDFDDWDYIPENY